MEQKNALFEQMPVRKAFFKLALPVVLSMVVSLVYNMVDTYFIAKTGNAHLVAGVALGSPVFTLMIAVGDIFGLGGSSFISRLFGQKRDQDGKRLSVFCFYGALFTGVGITALLLLLRTPLLTVLGAQADTVQYARDYYTWIAVGAPFIILSFTPCNQLRTEGFANASMIGSILGAVVNIVLDPVLIFGCKLGAAGAAIATVIGYVFTDLYYVWFLIRRSRHLSVNIRLLRVSRQEVGQVFAIGIPASITNIAQSFCVLITNRFLVPYGHCAEGEYDRRTGAHRLCFWRAAAGRLQLRRPELSAAAPGAALFLPVYDWAGFGANCDCLCSCAAADSPVYAGRQRVRPGGCHAAAVVAGHRILCLYPGDHLCFPGHRQGGGRLRAVHQRSGRDLRSCNLGTEQHLGL